MNSTKGAVLMAIKRAAVAYVVASGPCADADAEYSYCGDEDCAYCLLCRSVDENAIKRAAVAYLLDRGPCEDGEQDEDLYCDEEDCAYCELRRAVRDYYRLPESVRES